MPGKKDGGKKKEKPKLDKNRKLGMGGTIGIVDKPNKCIPKPEFPPSVSCPPPSCPRVMNCPPPSCPTVMNCPPQDCSSLSQSAPPKNC